MRHPTEGTLRRLVDEPAGVADADREHAAHCAQCLSGLAALTHDAALTDAALHTETSPDVDAGWRRLFATIADGRPQKALAGTPKRRWGTALRNPVLAVAAAVALLAGGTAAAATNWLQIFHTERIAPVTAPQFELASLPDLDAFGDVEVTQKVDVHPVADAAAAQQATGLAVPTADALPKGVTGQPTYLAGAQASAVFTFSAAKTAQFAASAGGTAPAPPAGLDGSQFRIVVGPGVAAVWQQNRPVPAMVVVRATAPVVYSSGVPFQTARDYMLSLPGLPVDIAAQLRGFSGDGTTLPLPVPVEQATTATAEVNGAQATVITARQGLMAGVIWVDKGVVTAVAGSLSADEVLTVARGLRVDR